MGSPDLLLTTFPYARDSSRTFAEPTNSEEWLLSRLVEAREEEHRMIAAEVHDGPVQKMVAVGLRLQMLRARLAEQGDLEAADEPLRIVEGTTRELRDLLF